MSVQPRPNRAAVLALLGWTLGVAHQVGRSLPGPVVAPDPDLGLGAVGRASQRLRRHSMGKGGSSKVSSSVTSDAWGFTEAPPPPPQPYRIRPLATARPAASTSR